MDFRIFSPKQAREGEGQNLGTQENMAYAIGLPFGMVLADLLAYLGAPLAGGRLGRKKSEFDPTCW